MHMPEETVKQLAFDVACQFFKDEQLCVRYSLSERQLAHVREQSVFKKQVQETKRLLQDDGSEFVIAAKGYAKDALDTCHEISVDATASDAARINASKVIFAIARVNTLPSKTEGGGGAGMALVINTNLALNASPIGAYTLEASAEQAQLIEGEIVEPEYMEEVKRNAIDSAAESRYADLL